MERETEHKKKLEFMTQDDGQGWKRLVWKECEVINAKCPQCKRLMVVIQAQAEFVYGCCQTCGKYFIGN